MHPKLAWVPTFAHSLGAAFGSVTARIEDHVDPLKKLIVVDFGSALAKGDYGLIQKLAHAFAKTNDCVIERTRRRSPRVLVFETLTKRRLGPVQNKNPLT